MNDTLLQIYLNDHLAGFVAGTELAKRCLANNREGSLGEWLKQLIDEFREDRTFLKDMLACSGGSESLVKQGAGWLAEKMGRLKCNGSLLAYSDLSRVVELEALLIVAQDASVFWETCVWVRERDSRFEAIDFSGLKERAQRQTEKLRHYHLSAVQQAFQRGDASLAQK
jgi:hypothetical protein